MPSPFPGMDPYLEKRWGDMHTRLIVAASVQLNKKLPRDLCARIEERVYVESEAARLRPMIPDVRVVEYSKQAPRPFAQDPDAGIAVAEAVVVQIEEDETVTERFIQIVDVEANDIVVTVMEFLSPANKLSGEGYENFHQKRNELKRGGVNIVEIDLVRAGKRDLLVPQHRIPHTHRATYQACVWRACLPHQATLYAFPLQRRLPSIPIPLRPADRDSALDLQTPIEQCYDEGRFDTIDYPRPPDPPLEGADAPWAAALLKNLA